MARKNPAVVSKKAIKAQAEKMDAFVSGESEEESSTPDTGTPKKAKNSGKMTRTSFDLDADLHKRIKLYAVREDRSMVDVMREILAKGMEELEAE